MEKFNIKKKIIVEDNVNLDEYIAIKVKELRIKSDMSQQGLAKEMGLTRTSIVNIEKGLQKLNVKNLHKLCCVFKVKSKDILPF